MLYTGLLFQHRLLQGNVLCSQINNIVTKGLRDLLERLLFGFSARRSARYSNASQLIVKDLRKEEVCHHEEEETAANEDIVVVL